MASTVINVVDATLKGSVTGPTFTGNVDGAKFTGSVTHDPVPPPTQNVPVISSTEFAVPASPPMDSLVGKVVATNNPTAYAITGGNTASYFAIYSSGNLRTSETKAVPSAAYPLTVTASNASGTSAPQTITVTVGTGVVIEPPPVIEPPSGAWPGQAGNKVGHLNVPATKPTFTAPTTWPAGAIWPGAYPGSLKAAVAITSGTAGTPKVYAFYDFGSNGVPANLHDVAFVGCRFSMSKDSFPVMVGGASCAKVSFFYCSVVPDPAVVSQPPNGGGYTTWPTGGWCTNEGPNNSHQIKADKGYNTGFELWDHPSRQAPGGLIQIDHCDMWGGGCSISVGLDLPGGGNITDNWLHDFASGDPLGWHTNGIANSNEHEMLGANPVIIRHNVIAGYGLSNCVAFQNTFVGIFKNITVDNNFLSGWGGIPIRLCTGTGITPAQYAQLVAKIVFTNNVLSTGTRPINAWLYGGDHTKIFLGNTHANGNRWSNNKLKIEPGTTPSPDLYPAYTNAQDGQFLYPDNIFRPADFT